MSEEQSLLQASRTYSKVFFARAACRASTEVNRIDPAESGAYKGDTTLESLSDTEENIKL